MRQSIASLMIKVVCLAFIFGAGVYLSASQAQGTPGMAPVPGENGSQLASAELKTSDLLFSIPPSVKQGEVLRVRVTGKSGSLHRGSAWMLGKQVRLFEGKPGEYLALMPVSIFQKPGSYTLKVQDAQGQTLHTCPVSVQDAHYPIQNIRVSSSTQGLQPLPGEMETIQALKDGVSDFRNWDEAFLSPTPDCQNSPFGVKRYYNGKPSDNYHKGVDLRSPAGRPIKAINGGVVKIAKMYRLHGGTVGVDHGQGLSSIYIHMSRLNVKEGQTVNKGDTIGFVGSTGFATGPHLHWGLYVNGLPVNPNQWVKSVPRCG